MSSKVCWPMAAMAAMAALSGTVSAMASSAPVELLNQYVSRVGAHANYSLAFFSLQSPRHECKWDTIYIDLNSSGGRAAYAVVLASKRSEAPLARVSFQIQADGTCLADLVAG